MVLTPHGVARTGVGGGAVAAAAGLHAGLRAGAAPAVHHVDHSGGQRHGWGVEVVFLNFAGWAQTSSWKLKYLA